MAAPAQSMGYSAPSRAADRQQQHNGERDQRAEFGFLARQEQRKYTEKERHPTNERHDSTDAPAARQKPMMQVGFVTGGNRLPADCPGSGHPKQIQ